MLTTRTQIGPPLESCRRVTFQNGRAVLSPLRVEYDLTPAGGRLVPLIDALGDWWEELQPAKSKAA